MKKSNDKMVKNAESKSGPEALVCVRECVTPGLGSWQTGDKVTDPALVQQLQDSPYFEKTQEVE